MDYKMNRRNFVCAAAGCVAGALALLAGMGMAGCTSDGAEKDGSGETAGAAAMQGPVSVYSREDGSGTRGAFIELLGIEQKNDKGEKVDMTTLGAAITNSTSVMMTTVASDAAAIGYISLGSLNDTVKALNDGVNVEIHTSDSTTGVNMAVEGTCEIGMASRGLKDSEVEKGAVATVIVQEGIAVIVNPESPVDELTSEQVRAIYTGEVEAWEDVLQMA